MEDRPNELPYERIVELIGEPKRPWSESIPRKPAARGGTIGRMAPEIMQGFEWSCGCKTWDNFNQTHQWRRCPEHLGEV